MHRSGGYRVAHLIPPPPSMHIYISVVVIVARSVGCCFDRWATFNVYIYISTNVGALHSFVPPINTLFICISVFIFCALWPPHMIIYICKRPFCCLHSRCLLLLVLLLLVRLCFTCIPLITVVVMSTWLARGPIIVCLDGVGWPESWGRGNPCQRDECVKLKKRFRVRT